MHSSIVAAGRLPLRLSQYFRLPQALLRIQQPAPAPTLTGNADRDDSQAPLTVNGSTAHNLLSHLRGDDCISLAGTCLYPAIPDDPSEAEEDGRCRNLPRTKILVEWDKLLSKSGRSELLTCEEIQWLLFRGMSPTSGHIDASSLRQGIVGDEKTDLTVYCPPQVPENTQEEDIYDGESRVISLGSAKPPVIKFDNPCGGKYVPCPPGCHNRWKKKKKKKKKEKVPCPPGKPKRKEKLPCKPMKKKRDPPVDHCPDKPKKKKKKKECPPL